ncbi:MAG: hypothetical protein HKP61_07635 [Dactylosporangium sp.]|nr:hypothetical protein [Dactylosporangium sp.]
MDDEQPPKAPSGVDRYASGSNEAWTSLGYLIGGMTVWGLIGGLIDLWLHLGGIATGIGIVLGASGGIVLIVRRVTVQEGREEDGGRRR